MMVKPLIDRRAVAVLLLLVGLACGCGTGEKLSAPKSSSGKIVVMASIAPLAYFTQRVGGDRVEVHMLIPPGSNPHTFEPKPTDLESLSKARLLVLNGISLEYWADAMVDAAHNQELKVVKTAGGLPLLRGDEHGELGNPHVWLDPIDAIHQVEKIRDALTDVDPSGSRTYRANTDALITDLRALDSDIRATAATFRTKSFAAQHATWDYLAKRYGLTEAAVIETKPGMEPSPRDIEGIVKKIKANHIRAVFAEPQLSPKAAQAVASEAGIKLLVLNPMGIPPDYDYLKTMRYNLARMREGLG
jgi:ABC-type Zn uptake system ZnuABC Zn-binding protein ZnuA